MATTKTAPLADRFWEKVDKNGPTLVPALGPCWVWTGGVGTHGYGVILRAGWRSPQVRAHRVAFFLAEGRWPEPSALHKCDNTRCVRRSHLYEGTQAQNIADMVARGRQASAKLTNEEREDIVRRRRDGATLQSLAARFGLARSSVTYIVKRGQL